MFEVSDGGEFYAKGAKVGKGERKMVVRLGDFICEGSWYCDIMCDFKDIDGG